MGRNCFLPASLGRVLSRGLLLLTLGLHLGLFLAAPAAADVDECFALLSSRGEEVDREDTSAPFVFDEAGITIESSCQISSTEGFGLPSREGNVQTVEIFWEVYAAITGSDQEAAPLFEWFLEREEVVESNELPPRSGRDLGEQAAVLVLGGDEARLQYIFHRADVVAVASIRLTDELSDLLTLRASDGLSGAVEEAVAQVLTTIDAKIIEQRSSVAAGPDSSAIGAGATPTPSLPAFVPSAAEGVDAPGMSPAIARLVAGASLILTVGFTALAAWMCRKPARVRTTLDGVRLGAQAAGLTLTGVVLSRMTPPPVVVAAVLGGLVLGVVQGRNLEVWRDDATERLFSRRSWVAVGLWGVGMVVIQLGNVALRNGALPLGQGIGWFGAALGAGLIAGRSPAVAVAKNRVPAAAAVAVAIIALVATAPFFSTRPAAAQIDPYNLLPNGPRERLSADPSSELEGGAAASLRLYPRVGDFDRLQIDGTTISEEPGAVRGRMAVRYEATYTDDEGRWRAYGYWIDVDGQAFVISLVLRDHLALGDHTKAVVDEVVRQVEFQ